MSRQQKSTTGRREAPSTIRIVILETDEPHPEIHDSKGSYAEILHNHFSRAGADHDPPLKVETDVKFVVKDKGGEVPSLEEVMKFEPHGVLITGSMYDAHGDEEWIKDLSTLLESLWRASPYLHFSGVCFGHQLLCRLLGSEVKPAPSGDWELGHSAIQLTKIGQALFRTEEKTIHLHQMHEDQVVAAPDPSSSPLLGFDRSQHTEENLHPNEGKVHVWGHSEHTPIQGIYIRNRLFTTQAHLAFDQEMVKREMEMRVEKGVLDDKGDDVQDVSRAKATAHLDHDGKEVAAALLRFWAYDDDGIE